MTYLWRLAREDETVQDEISPGFIEEFKHLFKAINGRVGSGEQLEKALDWFAAHPAIRDVLITGGDPLFLSDRRIKYISDQLGAMQHVVNIRWASRAPVTVPMRITDELAELLGSYVEPGRRNVCFVTHIESAAEITPELAEAVFKLRRQRKSSLRWVERRGAIRTIP